MSPRRANRFRCVFFACAASLACACSAQDDDDQVGREDAGHDGGAGGDSDADAGGDAGGDASDTDTGIDFDGDGYSAEQGDCNEQEKLIGPQAIEDLGPEGKGDEVDNDCDGLTDEKEECDCPEVGDTAPEMAMAVNLCDARFVKSVKKVFSSSGGLVAYATLSAMGNNDCIWAHQGCEMGAISTGPVGQANPNYANGMGLGATLALDPKPKYQGSKPTTAVKNLSCDVTQLVFELCAPANARGFSFDFLFASAEYDEWIKRSYNDTFYAIIQYDELNGGETTNIAFDDNGGKIEVDSNFFENAAHPCDESGSGWEPEIPAKAGSTGWLRTTWNVEPGDAFTLTFSIHDEGDCRYDSIAFLDNFVWHTEPVEPGTTPVL